MIQYVVTWKDPTLVDYQLEKSFRKSSVAEQFMDKLVAAATLLDDGRSEFASSLQINMEIR